MKRRLLFLPAIALAGAVFCATMQGAATVPNTAAARAAVGQAPGVVEALMHKAQNDPSMAAEILRYANATDTKSVANVQLTAAMAIKPGCVGSFSDRHTIKFPSKGFGITIAWQEVTVHGFCWNGHRITWRGGATVRRYSALPYCWKDTSEGDVWNAYPKWREAFAYGVLGGNTGFGCVSLQSDEPHVYYANGGGIFRY
jgi:hypothetical protein